MEIIQRLKAMERKTEIVSERERERESERVRGKTLERREARVKETL